MDFFQTYLSLKSNRKDYLPKDIVNLISNYSFNEILKSYKLNLRYINF